MEEGAGPEDFLHILSISSIKIIPFCANSISPSESAEEKISLSDRFGLWLGFYQCSQDDYLGIVNSYAKKFKLKIDNKDLSKLAIEWSATRGSRSGRVAWQFIQDLAGKLKVKLK